MIKRKIPNNFDTECNFFRALSILLNNYEIFSKWSINTYAISERYSEDKDDLR